MAALDGEATSDVTARWLTSEARTRRHVYGVADAAGNCAMARTCIGQPGHRHRAATPGDGDAMRRIKTRPAPSRHGITAE